MGRRIGSLSGLIGLLDLVAAALMIATVSFIVCFDRAHAARVDANISHTIVPDPPEVWIELLSPPVIESECLSPRDADATLNVRCRTIILGMHGSTFPLSSISLTAVVQNRVLSPAYNANRLAFGIAQRWSEVVAQIKVSTVTSGSGSLMFIELPNCASFDLSREEDLNINTKVKDLVQSFVEPSSGVLQITLGREEPAEVNWRIVAFGYVSVVPAAITSLMPFSPTVSELQYLLLFTRSPSCSFPYVRSLSAEMHRLVFPSVAGNDAGVQLLHNSLIVLFIFAFQIFLLLLVKMVLKCNFTTAMAMVYFPSASISASLFLLPGIAHASARLVFYGDDEGAAMVFAGVVGFTFSAFLALAGPYLSRRFFQNVMLRGTAEHLIDFPKALQILMPTEMWGPSPRVNSYLVPCAFIGGKRRDIDAMKHNCRPFAVAAVVGVVTAIEAPTPVLCSLQAAAVTILWIVVPILETVRPIYRCPALSFLGSVTMVFTSLIAFTFFLHGVRPTFVTYAESPLTVMIVVVVFALMLRSLATITVGGLELCVVKPRVWPKDELVTSNLEVRIVSDSDEDEEHENIENDNEKGQGTSSRSLLSKAARRKSDAQEGGGAKDAIKSRLRSFSSFVETKARANSKAMADEDDEYQPPNVVPKRKIKRAERLASHLPSGEAVSKLHAALEEEMASYDYKHSIETKLRENGGVVPLTSREEGRGAEGVLDEVEESEGVGGLNRKGVRRPFPVLGPVPPLDPSLVKKTKVLTRRFEEEEVDGVELSEVKGVKGVTFNLEEDATIGGVGGVGGYNGGGLTTTRRRPPISSIILGRGPMPPELAEARRREYELL